MIEHDISGASGSGDRSGVGRVPRRSRQVRTFLLGLLVVLVVVGAIFWRPIAILWCWSVARASSAPDVIAWNCAALADLGPSSLPALARLADGPDLQRSWSAGAAIAGLHERVREANAPIHDLLLGSSARVRAAAGLVLVSSSAHDASGLAAALEGLASPEPDVRFFAAYHLCFFPGDRFEREVPDAPRVFARMVKLLAEGITDERRIFIHAGRTGARINGQWRSVSDFAKHGLERLDPALSNKDDRDATLKGDDERAFGLARGRRTEFFRSESSAWTKER